MEKQSKRAILRVALAAVMLGVTSMSFGSSFTKLLSPKIARGAALYVDCNCAFFGGNNNCAANNYGSTCSQSGSNYCDYWNGNCEG